MLSKAKIKFIKSLQIKKYRKQEQCFIAQGAKTVRELLASDFDIVMLAGTSEFLSSLPGKIKGEIIQATDRELDDLGVFETNDTVIAVARTKPNTIVSLQRMEFGLVLDDIRDPGNLGTIVRTADWYGIHNIIASEETADFYNPKVISASMGSFTRVKIFYGSLQEYLLSWDGKVYGAYLEGSDVHAEKFAEGGLLLIGNESHGISPELEKFVTNKITIPKYGHAESLNAAIATGIICDNVRRIGNRDQ